MKVKPWFLPNYCSTIPIDKYHESKTLTWPTCCSTHPLLIRIMMRVEPWFALCAGIVFLNVGESGGSRGKRQADSSSSSSSSLPTHIQYKIRMDMDNVPTTNRIKDRSGDRGLVLLSPLLCFSCWGKCGGCCSFVFIVVEKILADDLIGWSTHVISGLELFIPLSFGMLDSFSPIDAVIFYFVLYWHPPPPPQCVTCPKVTLCSWQDFKIQELHNNIHLSCTQHQHPEWSHDTY